MKEFLQYAGRRRPRNNRIAQQRLRAWRPILTPGPVIVLFTLIGVIFIGFGIAFIVANEEVTDTKSFRYDNHCSFNSSCSIPIHIDEDLDEPIYFYYRIDGFFQNYRQYVRSRSDAQLRGDDIRDVVTCGDNAYRGENENDENMYLPCGLVPFSNFNDSFTLVDSHGEVVKWTKEHIAWKSDREHKFKNPSKAKTKKGIRVIDDWEDEEFIVWMRVSTFPSFKKLHRIIKHDLKEGHYTLYINNSFPVEDYDAKKYVYFTTTSWIGSRNLALAISFIVVGALSFLLALLFAIKNIISPRQLGDHRLLHWFK